MSYRLKMPERQFDEELRCNQIFQLLHYSNLTLRDILLLSDSERTILTKLFIDKYFANQTELKKKT